MKIADFGLATIINPSVPERLKCGSPGYVAPEILKDMGYDTKADIFSAGIIFCIILTGISPFYDTSRQNMLQKNKEAIIDFKSQYWSYVSIEAKHLVGRMVAKDPKDRCTAMEALQDPWFLLEHNSSIMLSSAQDNIKKYNDSHRFDVSRIKPEFSMVSCTPLLNARFLGKGSPLIVPLSNNGIMGITNAGKEFKCQTPGFQPKSLHFKGNLVNRFKAAQNKLKKLAVEQPACENNDSGDFDEDDMDEKVPNNKELNHCIL